MRNSICLLAASLSAALAACGSNNVSSNDDARRAYLGLDGSIDKALDLGFKGFNDAQSANIPTETGSGDLSGTLSVSGQVDQGSSANREMRLDVAMANYSDVANFIYSTGGNPDGGADAGAAPALDMKLMNIPAGTLQGSLVGTYTMSGALAGPVTLNLTFTGTTEVDPDGGTNAGVIRKPGTTQVTGTATSPAGTYTVNVTK
jgi:hypothetical protein